MVSELLTLSEACERFGLYPQMIYNWASEGRLHAVKPIGRILYPAWELTDLVESFDSVNKPS
jgi:excisionase family DNA binding protein